MKMSRRFPLYSSSSSLLFQLKKLRAIIVAGGTNYENFHECLKNIQRPFEAACTDLRSQVVREACITLAYLSLSLKSKFASFGETILLTLMNLIQNSAKVSPTECYISATFRSYYYPNCYVESNYISTARISLCLVEFYDACVAVSFLRNLHKR